MSEVFLPERLRPTPIRRRSRRPLLLLAVLAATPLMAPWWRVRAVELVGYPGLPASVSRTLEDLVGSFPLTVDPQWVRRQVEVWPGVAAVDVRLQLPGTLRVSATPVAPQASVPSGRGWHAVAADGAFAGTLERPQLPVLEGFSFRAGELRQGLEVAGRIARGTGAVVEVVRSVTPVDLEVQVRPAGSDRPLVVRVRPRETAAERFWCATVAQGAPLAPWADLRSEDRLVIGGAW